MSTASGVNATEPQSAPANVPRRRFVNVLLGTGLLASAASFLYPIRATWFRPSFPTWLATRYLRHVSQR